MADDVDALSPADALGQQQFDATLDEKRAWDADVVVVPAGAPPPPPAAVSTEAPAPDRSAPTAPLVLGGPTVPVAVAPGSRDPRRAADVGGAAAAGARDNWTPTGPRNVTGRVLALAVEPGDPNVMWAGTASGGVYRSRDGGETWTALWHAQPSLAVSAISICAAHPEIVWVATGEVDPAGAKIVGNGVYRTTNGHADVPDWHNGLEDAGVHPPVPGAADHLAFSVDAIAAHPVDADHCWAVGPQGVFRTTNGGAAWMQFEAGRYYSDVVFAEIAPGHPAVYLVCCDREGTIVRVDDPAVADPGPAILAAANRFQIVAPPPPPVAAPGHTLVIPNPVSRGKIALTAGAPHVAFVRFVDTFGHRPFTNLDTGGPHRGIWRSQDPDHVPFNGSHWLQLNDHVDWQDEGQGTYNLSIAVDPANANRVVTGMVELYVCLNANAAVPVNWLRAQVWEIFNLDRAHHADNHAALFAPIPGRPPGDPPALWVGNDGGISRSENWSAAVAEYPSIVVPAPPLPHPGAVPAPQPRLRTLTLPLPPGVVTWQKRGHGISASQMYDLTQSPLSPTIFGCGFQDNGVWLTEGGQTWDFVLGADGGFVAFDPDDTYRALVTWQSGISEATFPGALVGTFPRPGDSAGAGLWPRALGRGFARDDEPLFVADTIHHPRKRDRVLHARRNRLYGLKGPSGDRWDAEQVGRGLELTWRSGAAQPRIQVLPTPGAHRLGFFPQVAFAVAQWRTASVRSFRPGPYALQDGDELHLRVDAVDVNVTFHPGHEIADLGHASVAELAAYIRRETIALHAASIAHPGFDAQPCFWPTPVTVELTSEQVGPAATIELDPASTVFGAIGPGFLPRIGATGGVYHGSADRPAIVTLGFPGWQPEHVAVIRNLDHAPPLQLRLRIQGGAWKTVTFDAATFADPTSIRAGELAQALRAALAGEPVHVAARTVFKAVRLFGTGGAVMRIGGTAAQRLNLPGGVDPLWAPNVGYPVLFVQTNATIDRAFGQNIGHLNSFDLAPHPAGAALTLTLSDVNAVTPPLVFTPPTVRDPLCVTVEELFVAIAQHLIANPVNVGAELFVGPDVGGPSEIAYAPGEPDAVWVGGEDGTVYRSRDDGAHWEQVDAPQLQLRDRSVEAIAIHPNNAQTVFVGLAGRDAVAHDPGFLYRRRLDGLPFEAIGAQIADSTGRPVGVNALEIDQDAPDTIFAATDIGVFRSVDGGDHWAPFNEGLPNTKIVDLAFEESTRTLRAGAWGRGTYERRVGDVQPEDVRLYVRSGPLDVGFARPTGAGPEEFSTAPRQAATAASPDVKTTRVAPPNLGPSDADIDGVEFDDAIVHEEPVSGQASHVFVQVHNRGAFPAEQVRVAALWAEVTAGPPPLTADLWAAFAAGPLAGPYGGWTLIGDDTLHDPLPLHRDVVDADHPRVRRFDYAWPNLDAQPRIGILVLVSGRDDALASHELDVATLVATEPKAAYRETATHRAADDALLFLRQTSPLGFTVAAPAGPTPSADAELHLALGGPQPQLLGTAPEPFVLNVGAPRGLTFRTDPQNATVTFVQGEHDIFDLTHASPFEVAAVINRQLYEQGFPARADVDMTAQGPAWIWRFSLRALGEAQFTITGGAAAGPLGLPLVGPTALQQGGVGNMPPLPDWTVFPTFNLPPGSDLTLTATNATTVLFRQGPNDIPNLAAATAHELRRVLNRAFAAARLAIEAVTPEVDLWVRRSTTDVDGVRGEIAAHHLAEIVARPAAVAAGPARDALFDLVGMLAPGPLAAGADNFLYVRAANLGAADQPDARFVLRTLDLTATPIATAVVSPNPAVTQTVPAGGTAIAEIPWHTGALAAGSKVFLLAVVDHPTREVAVPATFPSLDDVDAFCAGNPAAAYRAFVVGH